MARSSTLSDVYERLLLYISTIGSSGKNWLPFFVINLQKRLNEMTEDQSSSSP